MFPRYGELLISHIVIGKPLHLEIPETLKSQPPGISVIKISLPHVSPASVDLSNTKPSGPAQLTYTSPFGPIAGTAPSSVLSLSIQSPLTSLMVFAGDHVNPASVDFENLILELSAGFELP